MITTLGFRSRSLVSKCATVTIIYRHVAFLDKKFYSQLFGKTNKMPLSNLQWTNIQSKTSRCGNTFNSFMVQKSQLCAAHLAEQTQVLIRHIARSIIFVLFMCIVSQAKISVSLLCQQRQSVQKGDFCTVFEKHQDPSYSLIKADILFNITVR